MSESLKDQLIRAGLASARPVNKKKSPVRKTETDLATAYRLRKNKAHSVRDPEADIARNFMFKGRIRKVLVNKNQLAAVNSGELVIVYLAGSYHLVQAEFAGIVQEIAPDHLPDLGAENSPADEGFPVPDDLVW